MSKVSKVFILRQVEGKFPDIKKGDIFALEIADDGKLPRMTEWAIAVDNPQENPNDSRELYIPSDKVYLVIGKPEISSLSMVRPLDS